jgi:digeranylgeranylglycerophospholipid reductase
LDNQQTQVVVIGAGVAGLLAAYRLAQAGLDCILVEGRAQADWGSSHCVELDMGTILNGILPAPSAQAQLYSGDHGTDILSPTGRFGFNLSPVPVVMIRLGAYEKELLAMVREAGVQTRFGLSVAGLTPGLSTRSVTAHCETKRGKLVIHADLAVVATGNSFRLDRDLYAHFHLRRRLVNSDYLIARQEVRHLRRSHWQLGTGTPPPGMSVFNIGIAGPISTMAIWVSSDLTRMSLLAGSIPGDGCTHPSSLLSEYTRAHPFTGKIISAGIDSIPIRRPLDSLAGPGVVLIGNAASQVYPMTGCGVSLSGYASQLLAQAAREYCLGGRKPQSLWHYNAGYQRKWGSRQASSEVFVRGLRHFPEAQALMDKLFELGLTCAQDYLRNLTLGPAFPTAAQALGRIGPSIKLRGDIGRRMARIVAQSVAIHEAYRRFYPVDANPAQAQDFARRTDLLLRF